MKDGWIRVATATSGIRVADCAYNAQQVIHVLRQAEQQHVKLLVLPELCLTGYTCGDLFFQQALLDDALCALDQVRAATVDTTCVTVVGLPIAHHDKCYNVAAVLYHGCVLGLVPKTYLPNYSEFYEKRHFVPAPQDNDTLRLFGREVPFGPRLLFRCEQLPMFTLGVEICEDLWAMSPPSNGHAAAGATVIVNLSASDETVGKDQYRRELVCGQSARLIAAYLYADAGEGESTTDLVFAGHNLIAENGVLLEQSKRFTQGLTVTEIDVQRLVSERRKLTTFARQYSQGYQVIPFEMPLQETALSRPIAKNPFVPGHEAQYENILQIQSHGLQKRLQHTGAKAAVIGVSGGLDSALALLVTARAMDLLGRPRSDIRALTMPCFGTTTRTRSNAQKLCETMGTSFDTVDITCAVRQHFLDIGHSEDVHDVTYENAQARERTQVLMDVANQCGGLVVGTGDLSELALGWATYNGDHMSMYAVNASVPKTLVRHLVAYEAHKLGNEALSDVLLDILDTPVSPELLPSSDQAIAQRTEDLVGPYELHDFFLYYAIRWAFVPQKVYRMACRAYGQAYGPQEILYWLKIFYRRFFAQQFKRSCLPDGPKVGSVALSPRGDWRMPSDAVCQSWMRQLDALDIQRSE